MEEVKAKILQFIQSLSVDEPLNGDEVTEISQFFITELCRQNGEDDQIKHLLSEGLVCHCNGIGHPHWGYCEDCDSTAPFVQKTDGKKCLLCYFENILK